MKKFTFTRKNEVDIINVKIEALNSIKRDLEIIRKSELDVFVKENIIVQPIGVSCTCHRCGEGRQTCGDDIHFVSKWNDEERELPISGHSNSSGIIWTFSNGTTEFESDWFGFGEDEQESIDSLI